MGVYTVFWKHPQLGKGYFETTVATAKDAAEAAADSLPEEMANVDADGVDLISAHDIRNNLSIRVFRGIHRHEPTRAPEYELI